MNSSTTLKKNSVTPMIKQYLENKEKYKDCLLLFRMGDFFELFYEDAIKAAPILEVTLTKRGKSEGQDIPMCGVPHHSVDSYIQKLIKHGYKIAICDQLESPAEAKKRGYNAIVKRDVTRVITQGTLTEDNLLEGKLANYLASIVVNKEDVALAYTELSTMDFFILPSSLNNLAADLARINPSELLIADDLIIKKEIKQALVDFKSKTVTFPMHFFNIQKCTRRIKDNFSLHSIESLGEFSNSQLSSACSLIDYLCITQKKEKITLKFPKVIKCSDYVVIDRNTIRNLEIFNSIGEHGRSLFQIIDKTQTNAGGRLLKKFLSFPSKNISTINARLNFVEQFIQNKSLTEEVTEQLQSMPDFERSIARLALNRGNPRDLYQIRQALEIADNLAKIFTNCENKILKNLPIKLVKGQKILTLLNSSLVNHEIYMNQGDLIIREYSTELTELYNFRDNSKEILAQLKEEYKGKTGIQNLKLEFNNMLGYYLEVTKSNLNKIKSEEFIHRQTMVNGVRYVTTKLKEVEEKILNVKAQIEDLTNKIFLNISKTIIDNRKSLIEVANVIAFIDVINSFAKLSLEQNYCRPIIETNHEIEIKDGRHPVVEHALSKESGENFIANDCELKEGQLAWLITGPNMSGKSTFLRQNALITLLAHIGSYVPAKTARIGLVDRIFTRIGAEDDLAKGRSTFLVEMIETATILNQATEQSLIILDEVGRGTSTYDGIAIAWSCLEYIHNNKKTRTLFSTHYHELVELSAKLNNLKCYTVSTKEWQNKVIFMRKLIRGVASKSYGLNVAKIAGLPQDVIQRAQEILATLYKQNKKEIPTTTSTTTNIIPSSLLKIKDELNNLNIDNTSPKEALNILYKLKTSAMD
ncbi:MAG: DNA mismatch repair protein MutS [Rickettsiales bacterium]|nr:DNA mismatch repair protein MutS [Rickettsiales bacterium]